MNGYLRQSTASQVRSIGPFVDDGDFKTLEDGLTIANTDIVISANGGADTTKASGGATAHGAGGIYTLTWDATDTAAVGELFYSVKVAGALVVFGTYVVLEEAAYDAMYAASADPKADINVASIDANAITATAIQNDAITAAKIADGAIDAATFAAGAITAAAIATDAIDADALAADAVTEIQSGLATAAALATVDGIVDDILVDTSTTLQGELDGIQADTEDLQAKLGTPSDLGSGATVAANLVDIEAQTDDIGVAGAGLTAINLPDQTMNITGNITGDLSGSVGSVTGAVGSVTGNVGGTINGLTATALADFFDTDSGTTFASAVAGSVVKEIADNAGGASLTVQDIVDGVWDEDATGHQTQGTFGQTLGDSAADAGTIYAAVVTGAAGATIAADLIAVKAETAAILADTVVIGTPSDLGSGATVAANLVDIESQTDDIGVAGAGLTNINLPDQTMNITGDITGNLSGSVGSVTGAVGSVTGAVGSVTGNVGGNVTGTIGGLTAAALKDFFDTDSTETYAGAVAGSVVKEIADNAGGASLTVQDIVDGVWDEPIASHVAAGSTGEALDDAGGATTADIADAVWDEQVDGTVTARQSIRLANAANGGKLNGAGTTTVNIRDLADGKNRVTATVDTDGNRTAVTRDLT